MPKTHAVVVTVLAVFALLATQPGTATAQSSLTGRVVDGVTGTPLGAGFVVLTAGDSGDEILRTLTNADGRFVIAVPSGATGPYRLRSERIGYRPVSTESFLPDTVRQEFLLRITPLPRTLSAIEVREATECTVRPAEGAAAALVWDEARKALAAASWTASQQPLHVISTIFERDLDGRGRPTAPERHRRSAGYSTNPFVSRSPDQLLRDGYVVREGDALVYSAPDAHILQDPSFLDTHCFRLREPDEASPGQIGLAFEPAPGRDLPDVRGVLWLDRRSAHLHSIEYEYTNLPREWRTREAGVGTVEFLPLPSGAWIVDRWTIRIPVSWRSDRVSRFDRFPRQIVEAIREAGGEVVEVRDSSGTILYQTALAQVEGVVLDLRNGDSVPLPGATVRIPETWFADTTDERGRFRIAAPLTGDFPIAFRHPTTDWMTYVPPVAETTLERGRVAELRLAVPRMDDIVAGMCSDQPAQARVLVGTIRDSATGRPVAGASVTAQWQHISPNLDIQHLYRNLESSSVTDRNGSYRLCGLEMGRPALVFATGPNMSSRIVRVAFEPTGVEVGEERSMHINASLWRVDLDLRPQQSVLAASVAGIVTDLVTGRGVDAASIVIGDTTVLRTDRFGVFEGGPLPAGTYDVRVSRPGYRTRTGQVRLETGETLVLGAEVLVLQPMAQATGRVTGTDTGQPVANAQVQLLTDAGQPISRSRSDSTGRFVITSPRGGTYLVEAWGLGYGRARSGPVELQPGQAVELALELTPGTYELAPITVSAEALDRYLRDIGFRERQRSNQGYFLDRRDLEPRIASASDVAHLISHLPGVAVYDAAPGGFGAAIQISRLCRGAPQFYVDGFRIETSGAGGATFLGEMLSPEDVYAIEIYRSPSQIPPQYNSAEALCGVVLIWSQRGIGETR